MPKKKTTSWKSYDAMDDMRRQQMESVEDFTLRLENQYAQIQRADKSATMSDHVLTMHIIKRCCFDPASRALLLANMEEMTTRCLVDTVEDIFSGEAPWEDPDKKTKNKPKPKRTSSRLGLGAPQRKSARLGAGAFISLP